MITLLLAVVVLLPEKPGPTWTEVERLTPGVELRTYERGGKIERADTDVVVVYRKPDAAFKASNPHVVAVTSREDRIVLVFVEDLERYLELSRTDPAFMVALGRIIAHELEHLRRQSRVHDKTGIFKACLTRDDLLSSQWGR